MNSMYKLMSLPISILFFLICGSWGLNQYYQDCEPKECGLNNITYPFYIPGQQKSLCGHPGFEVTCNSQNNTIINISDDAYAIQKISYEDQSVDVINNAFINASLSCDASIHNFTLDKRRFKFACNHSEILLLQNCNDDARKSIGEYKELSCVSGNENSSELMIYAEQMNLSKFTGHCEKVVSVLCEGQSVNDIAGMLRIGVELSWIASNCSECADSGGRCGHINHSSVMQCFCPHGVYLRTCPSPKKKLKLGLFLGLVATGSSLGVVILIAFITIYAKRRKQTKKHTVLCTKGTRTNQNVEAFLKSYGSLAPKRYTYAEIRKMTNDFKVIVGEGGYGAVYRGKLHGGRFVAVKRLKKLKGDAEDIINEVVSISRTNHVNIVTLLGFCFEGNKRALVYEYLPNGSLEKFMHSAASGQALPLETLFSIAVGIAKGLDYLHRGCNTRILHFDIKPHNILLDEELCPKISDFGLSRLCPTKQSLVSMSEARGTIGYIAPEVFLRNFGGVSHKSDVYSYGMMLLDLVCGRKNVVGTEAQGSSEVYFPEWIYRELEFGEAIEVENDEYKKLQRKMILVSLWCIQTYPSSRPPMNRVLEMLEGPLESLQVPLKQHISSPPKSVFDYSCETPLYSQGNQISYGSS